MRPLPSFPCPPATTTVALLLALAGPLAGQAPASSLGARQYFALQSADSFMSAGQYDSVAVVLRDAIARDSTQGQLVMRLGRLLSQTGRCAEAVPLLVRAWTMGFTEGPYTAWRIARCEARARRRAPTLAWLDTALVYRVDGRTAWANDTTFAFLLGDSAFRRIAGMPATPLTDRTARWRFDIALFDQEAKRLHASLNGEAFSPVFTQGVRALSRDVPTLSDEAIEAALQRLVVLLNDGHSGVWSPRRSKVLQADVYDFSDGLFLLDGASVLRPWVGSRVLRIGGLDVDTLKARLAPYQKRDNSRQLLWSFGVYAQIMDLLRTVGAVASDSGAWLTLQDSAGAIHRVFAPADTAWRERKLFPPVASRDTPPLYLRNVGRNYWFEYLPADRTMYWQCNQVWSMTAWPIPAFVDSLTRALRATGARTLVLDLRLNNGGNAFLTKPMLHAVVAFEAADPTHRVFVISGRGTFSAAQILLTRLEQQTNAIFVGEPSSSRPNFVGEDGERIRLPHSGVMVNISFKRHQESAYDDRRPWIPVTVPATLSSRDYAANRDPAMAAILEIVRRGPR